MDPSDRRIRREIEPVPLCIDHLRYQSDVGNTGRLAMAERAFPGIAHKQPLERLKAGIDPVIVPSRDRGLVVVQRMRQVAQHPKIVDRMNVAGDDLGQRTHPRALGRVARKQRRIGINLVEIFDDRQRLDERPAAIIEGRHQALRVDGEVIGLGLIVSSQMNGRGLVVELLQIEGDADAEGGRGAKIAVEFHRHLSIPGLSPP